MQSLPYVPKTLLLLNDVESHAKYFQPTPDYDRHSQSFDQTGHGSVVFNYDCNIVLTGLVMDQSIAFNYECNVVSTEFVFISHFKLRFRHCFRRTSQGAVASNYECGGFWPD